MLFHSRKAVRQPKWQQVSYTSFTVTNWSREWKQIRIGEYHEKYFLDFFTTQRGG